jgi:hypothetical protein
MVDFAKKTFGISADLTSADNWAYNALSYFTTNQDKLKHMMPQLNK